MQRRLIALLAGPGAVLLAAVGGLLLGHYAWDSGGGDSTKRSATPQARLGTPPARLDANLAGLGVVLPAPRIHNLYWDGNWNGRAAHAGFHRGTINGRTATMATSGYFTPAGQYGIGTPVFAGSNVSSGICGATRAPTMVSAATVQAWLTCMVTTIATGVPLPGIRAPISNDLYVVYLPARTTITDNLTIPQFSILNHTFGPLTILIKRSCIEYGAYHAFSAALTGLFPYAIVPTRCFSGDPSPIDGITVAASHETIEAATDPIPLAGRIDNSVTLSGFARLIAGEAADICSSGGAVPRVPVRRSGVLLAPYWSNSAGACVTSASG